MSDTYDPNHDRENREHRDGYEVDSNGNGYDPDAGMTEPKDGRCNALLVNYEERYGEPRYCGQIVPFRNGEYLRNTCSTHKQREYLMKHAEEMMQTGFQAKTIDHVFDKYAAWKKVMAHGLYESLMGDSAYEYAVEYEPKEFDFSDCDFQPPMFDEDGVSLYDGNDCIELKIGYPTENNHRSLYLYAAAVQQIMMMDGLSEVAIGDNPMQVVTTEHAQLTSPTESDPSQRFETIEAMAEHHLNLPLSRLIRDHGELLEMGGVGADVESDDNGQTLSGDDITLEVTADPESEGAAPNALKDGSESERIVEKSEDTDVSE